MLPSIFVDNLFDDFFDDAFGRRVYRASREAERELYGKLSLIHMPPIG